MKKEQVALTHSKLIFTNEELSMSWQVTDKFSIKLELFSPEIRYSQEPG